MAPDSPAGSGDSPRAKLGRFFAASDKRARLIAGPLLILGIAIWSFPSFAGLTSFWLRLLYIVIGAALDWPEVCWSKQRDGQRTNAAGVEITPLDRAEPH